MITISYFATSSNNNICDYSQFISEKIFPKIDKKINYFSNIDEVNQCNEKCDVFVYRCREQQNYHWGYIPSYNDVLQCVEKLKPKIIVQFADEFYYENLEQHNSLANNCNLFLRQFNYPNYEYFENTLHIPLGYYNDFNLENKIIKPIKLRDFNWSFIGCLKSDRGECIEKFSSISDSFIHVQHDGVAQQISREKLVDIYLNTIFSPCPRGWTQLECNRIYESLMCGSIPVIACSKDEYDIVFKYFQNPPFILSETWEGASEICKNLLNDKDKLQETQKELLIWWDKVILNIQEKVNTILL